MAKVSIRAVGAAPQKVIPRMGNIVVAPAYSRSSDYPSSGLTPGRLTAILRDADEGNVSTQMQLFEEIEERDPHIASQLQTRKNAVAGLDWEVQPFSDGEEDKAIAAFIGSALRQAKNWQNTIFDLLDAIGKGIAVSEIIWGYAGGMVVPKEIRHIPQKLLLWDAQDVLKVTTADCTAGKPLVEDKFIIHQYRARSGHPSKAGVLRVCAWMYMFKNFALKDWVAFAEVYGMPLRLGKYSSAASDADKRALAVALIRLGSDAAGMVPDTANISFIEAQKQSSVDVYATLARYCDEQNSKAIVGQTLTADSGGGSYAQSSTHNEVRHDLTVADCKALEATLQEYIIRPLLRFNYGMTDRLPTIHFACEIPEDLKAISAIYKELTDMGVRIPLSHIYSTFNIPEPQPGEETTGSPASTPLSFSQQLLALKDTMQKQGNSPQQKVDKLVALATSKGAAATAKCIEPLRELLAGCKSLEMLEQLLDDPKVVEQLLVVMDSPQLQELLAGGMLAAELAGREREHRG